MVQFCRPSEYFFSTKFRPAIEQKGLYNRTMVSIRIEKVDPEKIEAMHSFFLSLQKKEFEEKKGKQPIRLLLMGA